METNNLKKYEISKDDISGCKLHVFYNGYNGWEKINDFTARENISIQKIIFIQGKDREHDSHHVFYKAK